MSGTEGTGAKKREPGARRISRFWLTLGITSLLIVLAAVVPSPFAIEKPGPVVDAFGAVETEDGDVDVVRVSGAETFQTEGSLNVLSVSVIGSPQDPVGWLSLVAVLFDRTRAIVPLSMLYPDGATAEEREEQNAALMRASQSDATAAALRRLGQPVSATLAVTAVAAGGPSEGVLREGDLIRTVAGQTVTGVTGLRQAVADHSRPGPVSLGIERDGEDLDVSVAAEAPEGAGAGADPLLGIAVSTEFSFPFDVDLELDTIGGPSAGLVFALAVYDELTPGGLTGGLDVSGTGTIDDAGSVGPIGGLPQKIWGAAQAGSDVMLLPLANCADIPSRLPGRMVIAPVASLDEAISAIESAAGGEEVPGLERCGR